MKKPTQKQGFSSKITPPLRKKTTKNKTNPAKEHHPSARQIGWLAALLSKLGLGNKKPSATKIDPKTSYERYKWIWLIIVIAFVALFGRAFQLQILWSSALVAKGDEFITSKKELPVYRGMITDTFGVPLAANAPLTTVIFNPRMYAEKYYSLQKTIKTSKKQSDIEKAQKQLQEMDLNKLAAVANFSVEKLKRAVAIDPSVDVTDKEAVKQALPKGHGSRRLPILTRVPPEVAKPVTDLDFQAVSEEGLFQRYYLQAEPNAPLLGYMVRDAKDDKKFKLIGAAGIERQYEKELAGEAGSALVLQDTKQSAIKEIKEIKPAVEGQDIHLTIDSRLQYVLYKELEQVGREQSARFSAGIVVDVLTGDVLALGSWPSFNSNDLSERTGQSERNRVLMDTFEPGSVMKPFTVAAALESGKYSVNSLIDTSPGSMSLAGYTIRDSANYGSITLAKLIQKSSNVASAKIALNLPVNAISEMQRRFGFGQKTALQFYGEKAGFVRDPEGVNAPSRATLSYGYGQNVTLAQVAQAYAALANHGEFRPLRLVKNQAPLPSKQVIDAKHAEAIVQMMELVTEQGGTAQAAAINGYRVAGKTGTSRRAKNGGYHTDQYRTIFAGIAPASSPRFVSVILVEDPRRQFYGGVVAAPVFHDVMKEALRLYNVPFDKPLKAEQSASVVLEH